MNNNINLDITRYSINELENLFKLSKGYNNNDIILKKTALQNIINKSTINTSRKEELGIFLDNIQNTLINYLLKVNESLINNSNELHQYDGNHFIIKNSKDSYTSLLETNKKINKSIIKKTYTIDSLFRDNYADENSKSHNYTIQLPEPVTKAITMSISSLEIPITYHNISEELNNNIFKICYSNNSCHHIISGEVLITITTGLYETRFISENQSKAFDIETEINERISEIDSCGNDALDAIKNNLTFAVNKRSGFSFFYYNNSNADTDYKLENSFVITIDFDVNNSAVENYCNYNEINQKLGWLLGFREFSITLDSSNSVLESTNNQAATSISRSICHINYPRYLYICIDDYQTSSRNYFSVAAPSIIAPNIVGRINILSLFEEKTAFKSGAAPGDFLYTQKHIREYFGPTDINKLKIQLLDEYGRSFSLNNMDWSFVISFECFYN